ncbi:hypothetical protein [Maribacter halichondriae]|uniref:hypothetical protein n=1 Tax=Maribacter halichondriae TaxID=2980554 RepID=UPI002359DF4B|nr:hypothetical protein [Maribacter sp. Hal144]
MFLKWFVKGTNTFITIWMALSVLILFCNSAFWINDYITHPQHGMFDDFDSISEIIKQEGKQFWYRTYFFLDFFWALYFLAIIGSLSKDAKGIPLIDYKRSRTIASYLFVGFAFLAFVLDTLEGIYYWTYNSGLLNYIVPLKIGCYLICLGFLCYWFLKSYLLPNLKSILRFVGTSILSIVFILLIYGLITMMPQGGTIIVDLFYHPANIIIFFFMVTFLAVIISHFPVYVDIWMHADNTCVALRMDPKWRFLGFGIVYYDTLNAKSEKTRAYHDMVVKGLRRSLGILLYIAVFNIFFGVITRFYEVEFNALLLTLFLLTVTLFIYYLEGERYKEWRRTLDPKEPNAHKQEKTVNDIVRYVTRFPAYYMGCTALIICAAFLAYFFGWSRIGVFVFLISLGCQMFLYIQFKIARTYFKYVYYSDALFESNKNMFNPETLALFAKYDHDRQRGVGTFYRFFGKLSDNISYLKIMRFSGIISLVAIILANSSFTIASYLNPLNIILLYIIFLYSLIVITFKHILYYSRLEEESRRYGNFFKFGIPLLLLLLVGITQYTANMENDLHELRLVEEQSPALGHTEFLKSMTNGTNLGVKNNYFFIGSYGGGLKANLWNLLLLQQLEQESDKSFLDRTLVMSGVSGGAVGIGNFASLIYEQNDSLELKKRIEQIGNSNVLSNELTYLLGKDWIREYIPSTSYEGKDRSYKSMELHAKHTGMKQYNKIGYADYWRKIYESQNKKFPALIMNTTSVSGHQGVASTVKFPDNTFAGADNITDFNGKNTNKTLTYFGAISTTNRFPLFSPTAKIPSKGSYLDGGYFENSGLLSALEIFDALAGDSSKGYFNKINPVFINIINSEEFYIAQKIEEYGIRSQNRRNPSEVGSIIGTIISIDKLPRYVLEKIKARKFAVEPIMMPHKLSYEKVKGVLNGEVADPLRLMKIIKAHNDTIDRALEDYKGYDYKKWGVVQPPLARILSKPAVEYQLAMVNNHPSVQHAIERILVYAQTETIINNVFQENLKRRGVSKDMKNSIYKKRKKVLDSLKNK